MKKCLIPNKQQEAAMLLREQLQTLNVFQDKGSIHENAIDCNSQTHQT
jgi:hypothetical protein